MKSIEQAEASKQKGEFENMQLIIKQILREHVYKHPTANEPQKNEKKYNIKYLKSCMISDEQLHREDLLELISKFNNIIKYEQNMVRINGNVMILGDIHGQFYDFVKILGIIAAYYGDLEMFCDNECLLFLGDYVDRGLYSVEVLTLIMSLKVNYPKSVFCLRGNHECRSMTGVYNFKAEVLVKYDQEVYQKFMQSFDMLPIACLINNSYFCVHGGISDQLLDVRQVNAIDRFKQIPDMGPFCDFMWADPMPLTNEQLHEESEFNNVRMCSIFFGKKLTNRFLKTNSLKSIIRAHEVYPEGFHRNDWNKKNKDAPPSIITIFSAPNYCGIYKNLGAILHIRNNNFEIRQYKEEPINKFHGYVDVFQWSIPEIVRVINQFCKNMINSLGKIYLKQFPGFQQTTNEQRLQLLLNYAYKEEDKEKHQQIKPNYIKIQPKTSQSASQQTSRSRSTPKQQNGRVTRSTVVLGRSRASSDGIEIRKTLSQKQNTINDLIKL